MARQRVVYVIEMRCGNGLVWKELACEHNKRKAMLEMRLWKKANPDDQWRVTPYYPRED